MLKALSVTPKTISYSVMVFKMTKQGININVLSLFSVVAGLVLNYVIANECGTVNIPRGLTIAANQTRKGVWPFAAAIYEIKESQFLCGGTLISTKHVLTAAHCVHDKIIPSLKHVPDDLYVQVGVHSLTTEGVKHINVSAIYVHPDWEVLSEIRYDADIAIILLKGNVTLTNYITPVCMPPDDDDEIDGAIGFVVGWGVSKEVPKQSIITVLNNTYCYTTNSYVNYPLSIRTFCGQSLSELPIKKISGGGFFVVSGSAWIQYGISLEIASGTNNSNAGTFVVLTNVRLFKNWIADTVKLSGVDVGEAIQLQNKFYCDFTYACVVRGLNVRSKNLRAATFYGSHASRQTNEKVELIEFNNGTMLYLLDGMGTFFPNLKSIYIGRSDLPSLNTKLIKRSNLHNMEEVFEFIIHKSDIEILDEDTLWDLPNLERFHLEGKLRVLQDGIFEKNLKLREVYLAFNRLEFLPKHIFKNNFMLDWANFKGNSLRIIETDFSIFKNIRYIFLADNVCINENYNKTADESIEFPEFRKITVFLELINSNCSSANY